MEKLKEKLKKKEEKEERHAAQELRKIINENKKEIMYYVKKLNYTVTNEISWDILCSDDNKVSTVKNILSKCANDLGQY